MTTRASQLVANHGNAIQLVAWDPVWIGAARRAHRRWRPRLRAGRPPLELTAGWPDPPPTNDGDSPQVLLLEVADDRLGAAIDWLAARRNAANPLVVALATRCWESREAQRLAATLLGEAGSSATVVSPRYVGAAFDLAERYFAGREAARGDPLARLPQPCWSPGWYAIESRDRV